MRKYWNALRYGNAKTKRILIGALLLGLLAIAGGVLAILGRGAIWGLIAIFSAILDLVIFQSVRFGEVELREVGKKGKENRKEGKKEDIVQETFSSIDEITEEDVKKLLIRYKVKKEHVPVMVDAYEEERIWESPAYLWTDRGYLHLLVLGEEPKNIAVSIGRVDKITYQKNVEVDPKKEYEQLRKPSFVNLLFQEYLPLYSERQRNGRRVFTKNLYVIAPGIKITSTSVKNANKVLQLPISFEGIIDARYSLFYREAYRMKTLLMDHVYSAAEYKEQVGILLKKMADSGGTYEDFADDLSLMVRASLVTREVADYYMDYRHKKEKQERKSKK